ncbi:hypothetical protein Hdeb2414_s0985g00970921 [Helianthus debilis subsp. tardiflorus]
MQRCLEHLHHLYNTYCTMLIHCTLRYHNHQVQVFYVCLLVHKNYIHKIFPLNLIST